MHMVKAMALQYISVSLHSHLKQDKGRLRSGSLILQDTFILASFSSLVTKETRKKTLICEYLHLQILPVAGRSKGLRQEWPEATV